MFFVEMSVFTLGKHWILGGIGFFFRTLFGGCKKIPNFCETHVAGSRFVFSFKAYQLTRIPINPSWNCM